MKNRENIAFFGTPELSVWVLEELADAAIIPSLIVTTPDTPKGRGLVPSPTPVKTWAENAEVAVLETTSLKDRATIPELANSEWNLFIVAAYNMILPQWLLDLPKQGTLNVHPSLLPKLRGPSPVRSAILLDQKESVGVSVMLLDDKVDHGPIIAQATVEPDEWPVRGHILDELLFREGGKLLAEVIPLWLDSKIVPEVQQHDLATYSKKFVKGDGLLDLSGDQYKNYLKFCAFDGWPGTYSFAGNTRIKITDAQYENGIFMPLSVIPEGRKEMRYQDFIRNST